MEDMMMSHIRLSMKVMMAVCLLLSCASFLPCYAPFAVADDDVHHHAKERKKDLGSAFHHAENKKSNEAAGQAAAWILVAANITVAMGLFVRGTIRHMNLPAQITDKLKRFNQLQKKFLLPVHCILNPLALGIALIHFLSATSACEASSLPEWGLLLLALISGVGILVKFKVVAGNLRKRCYQIHTNPIPIALLVAVLLIGHAVVD
ncbi:hypothetical protein [Desulfatirhabdium butyrativorans]|uniref:hypothetical protein n=1 Tax=Desulfatirhabdium butyrativorans TaxID=340467 RepID=UPI0003FBD40E|nr:hypothetical protein [Desulfatirhabdium butyrativorans]